MEKKTNKFVDFFKGFGRGRYTTTQPRDGWSRVMEPFSGAWQRNIELTKEDSLTYSTVFAAITLISSDIAKLPIKLEKLNKSTGIWTETTSPAFSPILKKPNNYQTRYQFFENWNLSILSHGNAYILKERDLRNVVTSFHILDPNLVLPLVSEDGTEVFYEVNCSPLGGNTENVRVPASEIIHDRINPIYHKLCGLSPIIASCLQVAQGRTILENSANFFSNHSRPGGVLTAAGAVSPEAIAELKASWQANYSGNNAGKVAILADGLTYKEFESKDAASSQLIEQLGYSAETVASVFRIPKFKLGIGDMPAGSSVEELNQQYYQNVIQSRLEAIELLLDEGLRLPDDMRIAFNEGELLRMNLQALVETEAEAVKAGIKAPNESRKVLNLSPVKGGDSPMIQQQNFSLEALSRRDSSENPFLTNNNPPASNNPEEEASDEEKFALLDVIKSLKPEAK